MSTLEISLKLWTNLTNCVFTLKLERHINYWIDNNVNKNYSYSIFEISVARGLWNNLIQPVGQKSFDHNITVPFLCPSKERPYLATSKNGKSNTSSELLSNKKDFISLMGTTLAQSTLCPIWFQQKITCHPIINQGCVYVLIKVSNQGVESLPPFLYVHSFSTRIRKRLIYYYIWLNKTSYSLLKYIKFVR